MYFAHKWCSHLGRPWHPPPSSQQAYSLLRPDSVSTKKCAMNVRHNAATWNGNAPCVSKEPLGKETRIILKAITCGHVNPTVGIIDWINSNETIHFTSIRKGWSKHCWSIIAQTHRTWNLQIIIKCSYVDVCLMVRSYWPHLQKVLLMSSPTPLLKW